MTKALTSRFLWTGLAAAAVCAAQNLRPDFEQAAAREGELRARLKALDQEELALVEGYNACLKKARTRTDCDRLIPAVLGKGKERDAVRSALRQAEADTDLVLNEAEVRGASPFGAASFRACLLVQALDLCTRRFSEQFGAPRR